MLTYVLSFLGDVFESTETYLKDETDKVLQDIEEEILKKMRVDYAVNLFMNSTLLPFRASPPGFRCFYCETGFQDMEMLTDHMMSDHTAPDKEDIIDAILKFKRKFPFFSVNVVNLQCRLCDEIIRDDLYDLEDHLTQTHDIDLPQADDPVVIPYKIANGEYNCSMCDNEFVSYHALSYHMNVHYPNHKCDECGAAFLAPDRLKTHKVGHSRQSSKRTEDKITELKSKNPDLIISSKKQNEKLSHVKNEFATKGEDVKKVGLKKKSPMNKLTKGVKQIRSKEDDTIVRKVKYKVVSTAKEPILTKMQKINTALVLIKNSHVLPFKMTSGVKCFYCETRFGFIDDLQEHNDLNHSNPTEIMIKRVLSRVKPNQTVKINVANVDCRLCDDPIEDFEDLKNHLRKKHGQEIDDDDERVVPFKLTKDVCECVLCGEEQTGCFALTKHMNKHYRNYVCDECGSGFLSQYRLQTHKLTHLSHSYPCDLCKRPFKSRNAMLGHMRNVHKRVKNSKCPHCPESFHDYYARQKHIQSVHNFKIETYKCEFCDVVFLVKGHLGRHIRDVHVKERPHECTECDKKFFAAAKLEEHIRGTHIGVRYECSLCGRVYSTKKTLTYHMRKDHPDSKFVCEHCDKDFVLKEGLVAHLRSKHSDSQEGDSCIVVYSGD